MNAARDRAAPRGGVRVRTSLFVMVALAVAVGLAVAVSPFASGSPDGLERVAEEKAFLEDGRLAAIQEDAPIPDYAFPGVQNARVATGLAGLFGALGVFGIAYGLALIAARGGGPRPSRSANTPSS